MEDQARFKYIKYTYKIGETIGKGGFAFEEKPKTG
jgi:hypothetical protein